MALARASYVTVVDRAAAFGSLGPLGADVAALDLPRARAVVNAVAGLGGTEVTPSTLRRALERTRSGEARGVAAGPVYVTEEEV